MEFYSDQDSQGIYLRKRLKCILDLLPSSYHHYLEPFLPLSESCFRSLLFRRCFCFWRYEKHLRHDGLSKVPYFYKDSKFFRADIRNSMDWLTGYEVMEIVVSDAANSIMQKGCYPVSGIGIILTDNPFFAIDLDHCIDPINGNLTDIAQSVVERFKDTYIEISPGGQGLHIFGKGTLNLNGRSKSPEYPNIEAYDGSSVRYITFTGHRLFKTKQGFHDYNTSLQEVIQWFETTFFPKSLDSQSSVPNSSFAFGRETSEVESIKHFQDFREDLSKDLEAVIQRIRKSKDHTVFSKLTRQIRLHKSPSEDDLAFCSIIVSHTQDYSLGLQRDLVRL